MNRTSKDYFTLIFKGICIGAVDVVPGVSGGTIALVVGIYEELINSIKSINLKAIKLLFGFKIAEFWKAINGNFLLCVVLGIGTSIFSLAKALEYILNHYPILIWSFFFGLLIASTIYVAKTIRKFNTVNILLGAAGIIIAYFITIISPAEANITYWFIFISGAIAICAMVLPGISGSFILVLIGMYRFILEAVSNLQITVILTFMAGAVIGVIAFSNVLSWLLRKYHDQTIALMTGFMIGSLNKVWPWKQATETYIDSYGEIKPLVEKSILPTMYEQFTGNPSFLFWAVMLIVIGFALIFVIEDLAKAKNKNN